MSAVEETKREKFVRLAENRTNKILDMIQLLGNLSSVGTYEYTQQDIDKIFGAIDTVAKETRKRFNKVENKSSTRFTLD